MRRPAVKITAVFVILLLSISLPRASTLEFFEFSGVRPMKRQIKWPNTKISIALSTSLSSPGPNFKIGTDVIGAARRAIARWSAVANITFVENSVAAQSISGGTGDGLNLITIADTRENNSIFTNAEMTGRTRVFFDSSSGVISEADICINPHPALSDGTPVQFSTDGTPGTYDLESTFTHEIGHFLGLDHSAILASTMQSRQGLNGVYGIPAFTGRTLSEEDRERVRALYGPSDGDGVITGKVIGSHAGAQVWAESASTGRVVAGGVVSSDGTYRIEALPPGEYRVLVEQGGSFTESSARSPKMPSYAPGAETLVRGTELSSQVVVDSDTASAISSTSIATQSAQVLNPRLLGLNGEMSNVAVPLEAGKRFRIYLGGQGVDQVGVNSISINSPFFKVEPGTLMREQFDTSFPVISFEVTVAPDVPFGDYTLRVQTISGEVANLAGGITIDPGVASTTANPVDDARFFVSQHYRDFLGRMPDNEGLDYWVGQLKQCGADANCIHTRRLEISAAFFAETEFQKTGAFVYGLYKTLGRRPSFAEFNIDQSSIVRAGEELERRTRDLAVDFVSRPEFLKKYPADLDAESFVDAVVAEVLQGSGANVSSERAALLTLFNSPGAGRAAVIERLISSDAFKHAEYNGAFVLIQYFAYLRRDPDEAGYNFWLNALQSKSTRDSAAFRGVACAFLNSTEYQSRFGMTITHTTSECR